jgi:hypothetical protein
MTALTVSPRERQRWIADAILTRMLWEFFILFGLPDPTAPENSNGATSLPGARQDGTGIRLAGYVRLGRNWHGSKQYSAAQLVR